MNPAKGHTPGVEDGGGVHVRLARQDEEIASLCGEVLERYEEATFVYRLSERIGSLLGERAIAEMVVREAAAVLGAHAAELWLKSGADLGLAASLAGCGKSPPRRAVIDTVATGRTGVEEDARGAAAWAVVPLPESPGTQLGALALHGRPEGRGYLTGEIKLMTAIAALTAAFIRNERLVEQARIADARRREDEIARQVHRGLLPRHDPLFAGLDVSGGFRAADGVGGDYYGYVAMADGSLGIAIADVSGHGVGAALYMAIAKGALESEARDVLSPGDVLGRVNEVLASDFSAADMFASFVCARFLPDGRRIVWSNAGHNPPLLLRADGEIESLRPCGPALGIVAGARFRDVDQRFGPNDVLVLYTDGVVETRDAAGRFFSVERLVEAARRPAASAAAIRQNILDDLAAHARETPARDDVTLVVVRGVAIDEAP
ncbi:MAG TPA: GAF domain-containing SpoIIE family protein phosphatase [Candidatus Polarisedimenticolaceae bacterium]|nr:GAF domain-containing SpoIIE family protein phosphatase [Candidatus Polarisedimenticolaceae bacterium]